MKFSGEFTHITGVARDIKSQLTQDMPITSFNIDGQIIQLISTTPAIIDESDKIEIAGYKEDGIINSMTYKNHSKNLNNLSDAKKISMMGKIPALIFFIVGIGFGLSIFLSFGIIQFIFAIVFTSIGFVNFSKMNKLKKCINILK